jgi:putative ABC transport system permease protein
MGRILLVCRLAARDLRRRSGEAVLLLLVITAATTTLTLGLILHGVTTSASYQSTQAATAGPDVVAWGGPPADVMALAHAQGVIGHTGPYPVASPVLRVRGLTVPVLAEGRDQAPAPIDQPKLTQGTWVGNGAVVLERSFADTLGIRAGDSVTLNGRPFLVAGIAVTAANPTDPPTTPGLLWLTRADARSLATVAHPLSFTLNLKLADPAEAPAFVSAHAAGDGTGILWSWEFIRGLDTQVVTNEQLVMLVGSWLLGLLAVASVAVLVGGRMAEQTRRVGLLKAVGGTPGLVAAVLLAEYLILALIAAAAGLAAGWLATPLLTRPSLFPGLARAPGAPPLTVSTVALVVAAAVAVAVAATLVPALRAARISTVQALADAARPPRRRARVIAVSARLPVPLLLGLRLVARRPRRVVLSGASIAITVTTIVAVLVYSASNASGGPGTDPVGQVMLVVTVALFVLAAINAVFITWATVLDARRSSALARALGANSRQVTAGLSAAQVLPALPGAMVGIPAGIALYAAVSNGQTLIIPPTWQLLAVVAGTLLVVAGLTAIPSRVGARRPMAEILQSETA